MKVSSEQIVNGIVRYADNEVIRNLPTSGKWVIGATIGLATIKVNDIIQALNSNQLIIMMGIIDDNGLFDLDLVMDSLKNSASKYGKMSVNIPVIGKLTFSDVDIDMLKEYIENE